MRWGWKPYSAAFPLITRRGLRAASAYVNHGRKELGENKHGIWRQIYSLPGFADHLSVVVVCFISPACYRAEGEILLVLSVRNGWLQESVGWILLEEKEAETLNG